MCLGLKTFAEFPENIGGSLIKSSRYLKGAALFARKYNCNKDLAI